MKILNIFSPEIMSRYAILYYRLTIIYYLHRNIGLEVSKEISNSNFSLPKLKNPMTIRLRSDKKIHIQSSADIFQIIQPVLRRCSKIDREREHLWLLCLDALQTVCHLELVGLGTRRTVLIDPVEIFHLAILKEATSIVLIHNHPTGNLKPSRADKTATEKLVEASRFLNIPLLDHLIISEKEFFSFLDEGVFETLETKKFIMFNSVLAMD
jgi:DNA repair protein RadC